MSILREASLFAPSLELGEGMSALMVFRYGRKNALSDPFNTSIRTPYEVKGEGGCVSSMRILPKEGGWKTRQF